MVSREENVLSYNFIPPSDPGLRSDLLGKSPSSAEALCGSAPLQGESAGCREWGQSRHVLFSNDRNVVGYVIGILILSQGTQGCKGLFVCCLVQLPSSPPPM